MHIHGQPLLFRAWSLYLVVLLVSGIPAALADDSPQNQPRLNRHVRRNPEAMAAMHHALGTDKLVPRLNRKTHVKHWNNYQPDLHRKLVDPTGKNKKLTRHMTAMNEELQKQLNPLGYGGHKKGKNGIVGKITDRLLRWGKSELKKQDPLRLLTD